MGFILYIEYNSLRLFIQGIVQIPVSRRHLWPKCKYDWRSQKRKEKGQLGPISSSGDGQSWPRQGLVSYGEDHSGQKSSRWYLHYLVSE